MKSFMKWSAVVFSILLVALLTLPNYSAKRSALGSVGRSLFTAHGHQLCIIESGGRILKAKYNLSVITRANEYIATLGSNTLVYRSIARVAADTDCECELLDSVLDLAVVRRSESRTIIALAESACRIETEKQRENWQEVYDEMLAGAEYPSVDIALTSMRMH